MRWRRSSPQKLCIEAEKTVAVTRATNHIALVSFAIVANRV
jgi:hypothetical protein